MNYFWAFLMGGAICVVGQLFIDLTKLTPARILTGYVVAGVVLSAVGLYAPLASLPVRGRRAPAGLRASAGKGGAHRRGGKGCYRHPDRRADRCLCGHHRKPCVRRGMRLVGKSHDQN